MNINSSAVAAAAEHITIRPVQQPRRNIELKEHDPTRSRPYESAASLKPKTVASSGNEAEEATPERVRRNA